MVGGGWRDVGCDQLVAPNAGRLSHLFSKCQHPGGVEAGLSLHGQGVISLSHAVHKDRTLHVERQSVVDQFYQWV